MERVRLSKDEKHIEFTRMDNVPNSPKKFKQSTEIEALYRFVYENDIRKEAFEVVDVIAKDSRAKK